MTRQQRLQISYAIKTELNCMLEMLDDLGVTTDTNREFINCIARLDVLSDKITES